MKELRKLAVGVLIVSIALHPFAPIVLAEEVATPSAQMVTGDVAAVTESVAEVNVSLIESQVEVGTQIVVEPTQDLIATESATPTAPVDEAATPSARLDIENQVVATTTAEVVVNTGNNNQEVERGDAQLITGEAVAVAAATTVANTTLVNSGLELNNVVVMTPWDGNLVVAPMRDEQGGSWQIKLDNTGNVVTVASASVTTGNNTQNSEGTSQMVTGEAAAVAQALTIANASLFNVDFFGLLTSNIWLWSGNVLNFSNPGSTQPAQQIWSGSGSERQCEENCLTSIEADNHAEITTVASASANTGGNTQNASEATMTTGDGAAVAVATTIANTTLVNSRMRIYQMLLLAPWTGDLIFAYPDLVPSITAPSEVNEGETISYQVRVTNTGYDSAEGVRIKENLIVNEQILETKIIEVDELVPGQVWETQIEQGTALMGGKNVGIEIIAESITTEESSSNNQAQALTRVVPIPKTSSQTENKNEYAIPTLSLSGGNNVGEFVYPGDGVTYDFVTGNDGPIAVLDTVLVQTLLSPTGEVIKQAVGPVGEIAMNKTKSIRFVLNMGKTMTAGTYTTETYVVGHTDQGIEVKSNIIVNLIPLRGFVLGQIASRVQAAEAEDTSLVDKSEGSTLGESVTMPENSCRDCRAFPWYLGVMAGSLAYHFITQRRRDFARVMRFGLTLPLAGYAGLLVSQPDCQNGLMLVEGVSVWCRYFLPIAYGIYGGETLINWLIRLRRGSNNN